MIDTRTNGKRKYIFFKNSEFFNELIKSEIGFIFFLYQLVYFFHVKYENIIRI